MNIADPVTLVSLASVGIVILIFMKVLAGSFKKVRPTERGLVERFGKYHKFASGGLTFVAPFIDRLVKVNITEQMSPVQRQDVITKDKVFMGVDAVVFYKTKEDEVSVKASQYSVANFATQIDTLGRTVLRDIIGGMDMAEANVSRTIINAKLKDALDQQTEPWGIQIVRAEIKDIEPPKDLVDSMEAVLKADNVRQANEKTAVAVTTLAEGNANAAIKTAEGEKQSRILRAEAEKQTQILTAEATKQSAILEAEGAQQAAITRSEGERQAAINVAEGQAQATELTQTALQKYFTENAQIFKKLETIQNSLAGSSKFVVPAGQVMSMILDERSSLDRSITPITTPQLVKPTKTDLD